MIRPEQRAQMRRLVLAEGWPIETVARRFGVHHSVVRRALRDDPGPGRSGPSSRLEPFKPYIVQRLMELPDLTAVRLFAELRERGHVTDDLTCRDVGMRMTCANPWVARVAPPALRPPSAAPAITRRIH